jgi:hypothetical protein
MSSRSSGRANRPVAISLCLILLAVGIAALAAGTAHGSDQALVPENLRIVSANPNRYLDHFVATFTAPPAAAWVHYDVVDANGDPVVAEKVVRRGSTDPQALNVVGPRAPGDYRLRVWLETENSPPVPGIGPEPTTQINPPPEVGPPAIVQVPRDTTPPAPPQEVTVTVPSVARGEVGYDVRWHNVADAGSPIQSAHYEVRDTAGHVVVPETAVDSASLDSIPNLQTPPQAGVYMLRVWLTDAEGNVGAPASVPLSYRCVRSDAQGGTTLSAGLGDHGATADIVKQGASATLSGTLAGPLDGTVGAPLCVFSSVLTGGLPQFLGLAITGPGGGYRFPLPPGPSRNLSIVYRPGQRELSAAATLYTRVHPTFKVRRHVVHNGHFARFFGAIPGPNNDNVTVVLQVKSGKGWLTFRRYRTRGGGRFEAAYHFRRTTRPTTYEMRAQVRGTTGYPYLQGESDPLKLRVVPGRYRGRHKNRPRRAAGRRRR